MAQTKRRGKLTGKLEIKREIPMYSSSTASSQRKGRAADPESWTPWIAVYI